MKRIIVILVSVLTTGTVFAYTGGLPWWLLSNTNSVTNSTIAVESIYATGTNTTRLILSGAGVTNMSVNGRTTTVVIATGGGGADAVSYTNSGYLSLTNVALALDQLLYVSPTVSLSGGGSYELGRTIVDVTLTWTCNKSMTTRDLTGPLVASYGAGQNGSSIHTNANITTNSTYTMTVNDGTGSANGSTSVAFYNRRYWGLSASSNMPSELVLTNQFSSELSNTKGVSSKTLSPNNEFVIVAYPNSLGTCTSFSDGSFTYSVVDMGTMGMTNSYGYVVTNRFYCWPNVQTRTLSFTLN